MRTFHQLAFHEQVAIGGGQEFVLDLEHAREQAADVFVVHGRERELCDRLQRVRGGSRGELEPLDVARERKERGKDRPLSDEDRPFRRDMADAGMEDHELFLLPRPRVFFGVSGADSSGMSSADFSSASIPAILSRISAACSYSSRRMDSSSPLRSRSSSRRRLMRSETAGSCHCSTVSGGVLPQCTLPCWLSSMSSRMSWLNCS